MATRSLTSAPPPPHARLPVACRACMLRRKPLFRPLSSRELTFVARMRRRQIPLPAGEQLPCDGASKDMFYTVYDGWAARVRAVDGGARQVLELLLPGDMFGLSAAVLRTHSYSIVAITDLTLCELDAARLGALFRRHSTLALGMLDARLQDQERADAQLAAVGRMGAAQRIAHLMLDLHERLDRRGMRDGNSIPFPLQRMHVADAVGLSKVHVMRALRELRLKGLAQISGRTLVIPDLRSLARYCGYRAARPRRICTIL